MKSKFIDSVPVPLSEHDREDDAFRDAKHVPTVTVKEVANNVAKYSNGDETRTTAREYFVPH